MRCLCCVGPGSPCLSHLICSNERTRSVGISLVHRSRRCVSSFASTCQPLVLHSYDNLTVGEKNGSWLLTIFLFVPLPFLFGSLLIFLFGFLLPLIYLFHMLSSHMCLFSFTDLLHFCSSSNLHPVSIIVEYVCPKCGHFNPSANAVRQARFGGRPSVSPSRPDQDVPKIRRGSEGGSVSSGEGGGRRISNIGNGHGLVPELVQVELDPDSDSARHLQDDEDGDHGDREEGKGARGGKEELKEGDGDGGEEKLDERSVRMDVDDEDSW